ncbi:MAG: amidohydrolase family protein [Rhodospirillales bacterium]|nr:amidohydrolase family protein [Rhodospirillales bacterium]
MKKTMVWLALIWLAVIALASPAAFADDLPIIDAHSQIDQFVDQSTMVSLLDKAGVSRVILTARGRVSAEQIASLARNNPDRIVASVRTKGIPYVNDMPGYYKLLNKQLAMPEFRAMAELILWHGAKGNKVPKWVMKADSPPVQAALQAAYEKGWPAVLHYEFRAAGKESKDLMDELEGLLRARPAHPFVLTHMGQLNASEVRRLIASFANIYFIPAWSNSITKTLSRQPWVNLFNGKQLADDWKALIIGYPDRFILGFDNVFKEHWGDLYVRQVRLWRKALAELPDGVAHAVAHGNAERLWKLKASHF